MKLRRTILGDSHHLTLESMEALGLAPLVHSTRSVLTCTEHRTHCCSCSMLVLLLGLLLIAYRHSSSSYREADELLSTVHRIRAKTLGEEHPSSTKARLIPTPLWRIYRSSPDTPSAPNSLWRIYRSSPNTPSVSTPIWTIYHSYPDTPSAPPHSGEYIGFLLIPPAPTPHWTIYRSSPVAPSMDNVPQIF